MLPRILVTISILPNITPMGLWSPGEIHTPFSDSMAASADQSCPDIELSVTADNEDKMAELIQRAQWLRAAILGANDGLLSTTALMLGVGAAKDNQRLMIVSGIAGALAGACSMAVGEFVSVSTQKDIEQATKSTKQEAKSEKNQESTPVDGSSVISSPIIARSPFMRAVTRDVCENHLETLPNPNKAAGASGLAFLCGSLVPILSAMVFSRSKIVRIMAVVALTSVALAMFGGAGAWLGGSPVRVSAMRVVLGGWVSMAVTYSLLMPLDRDKIFL